MNKIILGFIHKGLMACGFGPIIWAIVYFFLEKNGKKVTLFTVFD